MNNKIYIIGVGPGSCEYLTQAAIDKAKNQQILVGSQKALTLFENLKKETYVFKDDIKALVNFLKSNYLKKKIAVLVTGDPGLFSLANTLKKHFNTKDLQIIPGISSVQLFFARLGLSFEDVAIKSVHGREFADLIPQIKNHKRICILTDSKNSPQKITQALLEEKVPVKAWIGQNLSLENEKVVEKDLEALSKDTSYNNCLLYLEVGDKK